MSSRNARLKGKQRDSAPAFFQALQFAKKALKAGRSFEAVSAEVRRQVEMTDDITLEYFEIADSENLNLIDDVKAANRPIMCIAGFVGEVRLIDNMFLD